jgi:hypothetical protein
VLPCGSHQHLTDALTSALLCSRLQSSKADFSQGIRLPCNKCAPRSIEFMETVLRISGLGEHTFVPEGELPGLPASHHACWPLLHGRSPNLLVTVLGQESCSISAQQHAHTLLAQCCLPMCTAEVSQNLLLCGPGACILCPNEAQSSGRDEEGLLLPEHSTVHARLHHRCKGGGDGGD